MTNLLKGSLPARNPVFFRFLTASTCSLVGSHIFDFAIPLYVLHLTHSPMALSAILVALHLPFFLMAPFTGYLVDHGSKRNVMLYTDVGQVVCMFLFFGLEYTGTNSLPLMFLLVFVAKTLMITFDTVATFQLVPSLVSEKDLHDANSWFLSAHRLIQIVGPLAGGLLMSLLGVRACIVVNALSFGATLYFVIRMKNLDQLIERDFPLKSEIQLSLSHLLRTFHRCVVYVWRSRLFRPFICMMFLWNLSSLVNNTPSMTYYFNELHHFSPFQYGLTMSFIGLLGIGAYLVAPQMMRQYSFSSTLNGSTLVMAIFGAFAFFSFYFPTGFVILYGISRFGASISNMGTLVLRQTSIPRSMMGGVNSALRMFFMSAMPLSAYLQGVLIERYGVGTSFALGTLCLFGCAFFAFRVSRVFSKTSERPQHNFPEAA